MSQRVYFKKDNLTVLSPIIKFEKSERYFKGNSGLNICLQKILVMDVTIKK